MSAETSANAIMCAVKQLSLKMLTFKLISLSAHTEREANTDRSRTREKCPLQSLRKSNRDICNPENILPSTEKELLTLDFRNHTSDSTACQLPLLCCKTSKQLLNHVERTSWGRQVRTTVRLSLVRGREHFHIEGFAFPP